MKVAILGGGFTGLTTAYYLSKKNHQLTVFEKEETLGGLSSGFKSNHWYWYLEKTVHHLFSNDYDLLNFAKETGFNKIFFKKPETASLYEISNRQLKSQNYSIFSLDTPFDLLKFPPLPFYDKIRAGMILAFLKLSPPLSLYESQTAERFLRKTMGDRCWQILWQELFRKKFGKYAGKILASFIWARIKKRTKKLGYIKGGFQTLIDWLETKLMSSQVNMSTSNEINHIEKKRGKFLINGEEFDVVVSTLPTPVLTRLGEKVFPQKYLARLNRIEFLHAVSLILETDKPILDKTYWLNISSKELPVMGLFQQTNFIDKKYYGGKHILYCGWYVDFEDKLWKMREREIVDFVLPYLKKISNFKFQISNYYVFHAPFAQPIFDQEFLENKPEFITPVKNFYIANLDMTYPYDRGVNYAVKLGKQVAELL